MKPLVVAHVTKRSSPPKPCPTHTAGFAYHVVAYYEPP